MMVDHDQETMVSWYKPSVFLVYRIVLQLGLLSVFFLHCRHTVYVGIGVT